MIIQGKDGCLVLFWKDKLIAGFPLGSNTFEDYKKQSNEIIIDSLRSNHSIPFQIKCYRKLCDKTYHEKINGKKISGYNLQMFSACVLALIRFNVIDEDDVIFMAPRKRGKHKKFKQTIPF
jgi:hypothetical protein